MSTNTALVLFGGTGGLGLQVAKGLVTATGFTAKKAVVRDASGAKAKQLEKMGWTPVEVKNLLEDKDGLVKAMMGAKTVVSTVSGSDMVDLEISIIHAAKQVGASLFVPSQFGVDYRRWGSAFPFMAGKKTVLETAAREGLPTLSVFCGYFSDYIFGFFMEHD